MTTSSERIRAWTGPAILSGGFRPFFLMAGLWAALAMTLWLAMLSGLMALPTAFDPVGWHAHEFLWGYLAAVMAGFLLTAVPNWTGRLPIVGWPLAALAGLWLVGRLAVTFSAHLPLWIAALADLAFLAALALALGREIVAGRNWRNLPVLALVALMLAANAAWHGGATGAALRGGIAVAVALIALIGGRVVPSFTRNWLARQPAPGRLPVPANRADTGVLVLTVAALALWVALPDAVPTAIAALFAGLANLWRLSRWAGGRTLSEPLLWVLHLGFGFVPLGFLLLAGAALWPAGMPRTGMEHAWLAGAIGVMTLAMMSRATLGHSGRALSAGRGTVAVYLLVAGAALARIAAGFLPGQIWLLTLSGSAWVAGFGGFALLYAPLFLRPRAGARRG
ncbi:NnrS family protein [Phaeovulum sp.]|uniref:NnrS family protein n=2 Tax=Phaeovulum sp. TaxID=2934796 RepID=UPI002730C2D4|nr:NnrS family protein [Phaeovulum sp.]MDP1668623.1 NnrS family protein [Phaeovulum sp.]MDZ4119888.1 NnrS family protein [Phaeovulum sp.]